MVSVSTVSVLYMVREWEDEEEEWTPETYEEWLYDGYYNESRSQYNRSMWGGEVVDTDDPWSVSNTDPHDLTVPVMAYRATRLSDMTVRLTVERFLPWLEYEDLVMTRDGRGVDRTWQVTLRADGVHVELDRRGRLEFRRDMLVGPGDVIGSTDHFLDNVTEYLVDCDALPPEQEVKDLEVGRYPYWNDLKSRGHGRFLYVAKWSRQGNGYEIHSGEDVNTIEVRTEAGTGRMIFLSYHWPDLVTALAVTDLPPPETLMSHHGLENTNDPDVWYRWDKELVYYEPNFLLVSGDMYMVKAKVFFFLPYRPVSMVYERPGSPGVYISEISHYGVIFPDRVS